MTDGKEKEFERQIVEEKRSTGLPGWSNSIRARLVIMLVAFTVVPTIIVGVISNTTGLRNARHHQMDMFSGIATLKESQVQKWTNDLKADLVAEIEHEAAPGNLIQLLSVEPSDPTFESLSATQVEIFNNTIDSRHVFDELFLLNLSGTVILSTDQRQLGWSYGSHGLFRGGLQGLHLQPHFLDISTGDLSVTVSHPVISTDGTTLGVLVGRANLENLNAIMMERAGIGQTGETYLVGKNRILLTETLSDSTVVGESYIRSLGATEASQTNSGMGEYENYQGSQVMGAYRWIPELQVGLLAEQSRAEAFGAVWANTLLSIAAAAVSVVLAILAASRVSQNLIQPLEELTLVVEGISSGELDLETSREKLPVLRQDEIGSLARGFQTLTNQVRRLIANLEARVEERTQKLQKRSEELMTAAEVSQSVATILETDQLIQRVVGLIQEQFDLYYVGLFLVDENREWAVLKAGTGDAGKAMLERGHRLKIGGGSMIGWSVANARARIALEAGEDPVRLATSELPDTRSEAAIPLRSRGMVLGALTVQSSLPGAFDEQTITIFQTMADQVAVALDNARLFVEAQSALDAIQKAYGEFGRKAWIERLRTHQVGYQRDASGLSPIKANHQKQLLANRSGNGSEGDQRTLIIPIRSRGEVIGHVNAQRGMEDENKASWRAREIDLLETLAEQLGVSLESARLFEETQRRAERERLIGEITSQVRATLDIETILNTAVREMREMFELEEVEARLGTKAESENR